jgi:hypothetical protein
MKNIFLIPTDKPSRLIKQKYDSIDRLCLADTATKKSEYKRFNIYITSDEEIKEGDWCLGMDGIFQYKGKINIPDIELPKKIILTTDQDLIKDGVQTIDDEFLEWFIKNPSCEEVDVEKLPYDGTKSIDKYWGGEYKIIIPKEEPKALTKLEIAKNIASIGIGKKEEPKQETLEEASENYVRNEPDATLKLISKYSFKDGAKWKEERMYSETFEFAEWCDDMGYTQVDNSFWKSINDETGKTTKELFEQFKKK